MLIDLREGVAPNVILSEMETIHINREFKSIRLVKRVSPIATMDARPESILMYCDKHSLSARYTSKGGRTVQMLSWEAFMDGIMDAHTAVCITTGASSILVCNYPTIGMYLRRLEFFNVKQVQYVDTKGW